MRSFKFFALAVLLADSVSADNEVISKEGEKPKYLVEV